MTTHPVRPIADLDVPLPVLQQQIARNQTLHTLLVARLRKPLDSTSDRLAYAHDVRLVETDARVATDADYPGWAEHIARLQEANRTPKEAS